MGALRKSPREKELEQLKRQKSLNVLLTRDGAEVEATVTRPSPFHATYYATWKDPVSNKRVIGLATVQEVYDALERRVGA